MPGTGTCWSLNCAREATKPWRWTFPADQDSAGLSEYADAVVGAIGERTDLVLAAQSLGGFTAPLVCERVPVDLLMMLNAMVPSPGESPRDWWANTGHSRARREQAERDGRNLAAEDVRNFFSTMSPPRSRPKRGPGESRVNPRRRSRYHGL